MKSTVSFISVFLRYMSDRRTVSVLAGLLLAGHGLPARADKLFIISDTTDEVRVYEIGRAHV